MLVVGSSETPKRERVYHKMNCMYARRIKIDNRIKMSISQAENRQFCECKYCAGLKGDVRTQAKQIQFWENKHNIKFIYQDNCDTLYIQTEIGFWKVYTNEENGKYLLYHCNVYNKDTSFVEASHGDFHRQSDMKATESLEKLIEYIVAHDKAKVIMMDDYHKLPRHSKKQKKYYKQAERRAKVQATRRLDSIFAMLEKQNPKLREESVGSAV